MGKPKGKLLCKFWRHAWNVIVLPESKIRVCRRCGKKQVYCPAFNAIFLNPWITYDG